MTIKILRGSCLDTLKTLPEQSINTCITSPPYWGLRDYGTAEWEGGNKDCDHKEDKGFNKQNLAALADKYDPQKNPRNPNAYDTGKDVAIPNFKNKCGKCGAVRKDNQLGLEETPEEFVENLVQVFREVKRVLRDDGTVWLNLGDSYSGSGKGPSTSLNKEHHNLERTHSKIVPDNLKPKDLVGIPWRVAFALQADGWYLRQDIIWHKPNPMPESVRDRCTKAHEYIFLLSKSPKYYFDDEAIKEDAKRPNEKQTFGGEKAKKNIIKEGDPMFRNGSEQWGREIITPFKRNKRSVWTVTTKPFKGAHFASFPPDLIEPCVLAGCPLEVCAECNEPYVRQIESKKVNRDELDVNDPRYRPNTYDGSYKDINGKADAGYRSTIDLGLQKQCDCKTDKTKSGTVLDPFGGSGTTAQVALGNSRDAVLCELNDEYIEIAKQRIAPHGDLFIDIEVI
jgi:DNA modification methylase